MKGRFVKCIHVKDINKVDIIKSHLTDIGAPFEVKQLKSGEFSISACFENFDDPIKEQYNFIDFTIYCTNKKTES